MVDAPQPIADDEAVFDYVTGTLSWKCLLQIVLYGWWPPAVRMAAAD